MNRLDSLKKRSTTLVLVAFACLSGQAFSQKINWGGAANDVNVDSAGNGLTATFTFELGVFTNGDVPLTEFIPTTGNTDFWGTNWVSLDSATYNQEDPPSETEGFFSDSWVVPDNTYEGFQAYIWIYNNQAGDETSEWVLITDDDGLDAWKIPTSTGSQTNFPTQFRVSTATTPVFGGLNDEDGPGENSAIPPSGFALQTQTFLPVPESGTTILFGLTLGSLIMRRGRQTS